MPRPPKWKTLEEFKKASEGFFEWCKENDYIPDVEGLAVYMDTSRITIFNYGNKPEFSDYVDKLRDHIGFHKKQLALKGKIPAAIFCFDFHNNHGYKHRWEAEIQTTEKDPDIATLKKEIKDLVDKNGFH